MFDSDSDLWEDLLLAIEEEGKVVPIVGRDLLLVESEGRQQLLYHLVARRLAEELKVDTAGLPDGFDINDVICCSQGFHGDSTAVNIPIVRILKTLQVDVPEPLALLAEIPNFSLFISTSVDTLLERAIAQKRERAPAVVAFPAAGKLTDFDEGLIAQSGSVVFQILGRATPTSEFAVTDGQLLERMHDVMAGNHPPTKLIKRLQDSHLLVIGVNFPDWLGRFLLRLARAKPLWDSRQMMEVFAEGGHDREQFNGFVRHFSPQRSRLFTTGSPIDFVRELHRRWFERHPRDARRVEPEKTSSEKPDPMTPGSVFISYASEDRVAARRLADDLSVAGLDVWIDRRLNPGDDYRSIIETHIRDCAAFVPVLSQSTQSDAPRWFRREWAQACDLAKKGFGTGEPFLFPVVIDKTPMNLLKELKQELFNRSADDAPDGEPTKDLIAALDRAQKAWRRQNLRP